MTLTCVINRVIIIIIIIIRGPRTVSRLSQAGAKPGRFTFKTDVKTQCMVID